MSYGHVALPDKSNVSSLNQALGSHLAPPPVGARSYGDTNAYRGLTASPPNPQTNGQPVPGQQPQQTGPMVNFSAMAPSALKRKPEGMVAQPKRRREADDAVTGLGNDGFDGEGGGQGAKHWTDEEKTKLFEWLMGSGQDDHWNALRATKNSCLRECAVEVFDNKKTYQALKGCYERNFNLFKQIYAYEVYNVHAGNPPLGGLSEADRLRQYEQRLQAAKKSGCDVGNISARAIDTWHRIGWYALFYARWHGDPATTRPTIHRQSISAPNNSGGGTSEDPDQEDDGVMEFQDNAPVNGISGPSAAMHATQPPPHSPANPVQMMQHPSQMQPSPGSSTNNPGPSNPNPMPHPLSSEPHMTITLPQNVLTTYMHLLQTQTQTAKLKLEYLRRREENDRENSRVKQKAELATEILANPSVDGSLRESAANYLKGLFKDS